MFHAESVKTWDFENRLTQVTLPGTGGTVTFKYDPFGRRIQKSGPLGTTNYLCDGRNVLEEVDNSGSVLARYTEAGMDEQFAELRSGMTSYYQQDGIDSVTSLTDSAGALANTYTFNSFGKLTASTGTLTNPFQFTGREFDSETGLSYYRARYYDTIAGRFISEDPIRFVAGSNFYRYVDNNPATWTDPSGLIHPEWGPPSFDGRLHDDQAGGLEVMCTKGRNLAQDIEWLEHSTTVRWAEIMKFGGPAKADPGHVQRHLNELDTLKRCRDECDKDKKPDPETEPFEIPVHWLERRWEELKDYIHNNAPPCWWCWVPVPNSQPQRN